MIDLSNIKSGDAGFVFNRFDRKVKDTYISGVVRASMNFQNKVKGRELIKHQHVGMFVWDENEVLWFGESVSAGWVCTPAHIKFSNRNPEHLVVKRYDDLPVFDPRVALDFKSNYNYLGLGSQLIRQLSFNMIDLEAQKEGTKYTYCSQSYAYLINKISNGKYCQYWHSTDTQDLYFDKASKIVEL